MSMYRKPLVPNDFTVPQQMDLAGYVLLPLTIDHAEIDYAAVMDLYDDQVKLKFPNHTLRQNMVDLGYHQKEMQKRASFTFTILNKEQNECLGCLYIYPADDHQYDAEVDMWIRKKYRSDEKNIMEQVKEWIKTKWPFTNPQFTF